MQLKRNTYSNLMLSIISFLGILLMNSTQLFATDVVPKIGYIPASFPRDPVQVNIFVEHLALGQVLQPLVESDRDGNVIPGVASSWTILNDGRVVRFKLNRGIRFSNGTPIKAAD